MSIDASAALSVLYYVVLKIGNLRLLSPFILAPLSGISDLPFRLINRSFGCELAFLEMISARALVSKSRKTGEMLLSVPYDRPLGVQLLANDPDILEKALEITDAYKFDVVNINAACPVGKVTRRGEGAGLLREPRKLQELLKAAVKCSTAPVTVKIRTGWDESSINAKDVALSARDAGVQGLFIHGRTAAQGYSGKTDYRIIGEIKNSIDVPVIASGDILSPELAKKMFDETGCDGIVMARGALGNPWIFRQTAAFLKTWKADQHPGLAEIRATMLTHLQLCSDYYGEDNGTIIFRKFFAWYMRGLPETRPLREKAFHAKTTDQMVSVIDAACTEKTGRLHAA
ncbi:MAG: tRNA dihydrouridine synthase DusB [Nitrospirae bacterium]|nr:tRNA dihydrouridine synthase DusB [Nitrospirota bacterium]